MTAQEVFFREPQRLLHTMICAGLEHKDGSVVDILPLLWVNKHFRSVAGDYLVKKFTRVEMPVGANQFKHRPIKGHYLELYQANFGGQEPVNADPRTHYDIASQPEDVRYMILHKDDFDPVTLMCTFRPSIENKWTTSLSEADFAKQSKAFKTDRLGIPFMISASGNGEPWSDIGYSAFSINSTAYYIRFAPKTAGHKTADLAKQKAYPTSEMEPWFIDEVALPVVFRVYPLIAPPAGHSITTSSGFLAKTPGTREHNAKVEGNKKCYGGKVKYVMQNLDVERGAAPDKTHGGEDGNGGFFPISAEFHLLNLFRAPIMQDDDDDYAKAHF